MKGTALLRLNNLPPANSDYIRTKIQSQLTDLVPFLMYLGALSSAYNIQLYFRVFIPLLPFLVA
jgi:hypothetical protein